MKLDTTLQPPKSNEEREAKLELELNPKLELRFEPAPAVSAEGRTEIQVEKVFQRQPEIPSTFRGLISKFRRP